MCGGHSAYLWTYQERRPTRIPWQVVPASWSAHRPLRSSRADNREGRGASSASGLSVGLEALSQTFVCRNMPQRVDENPLKPSILFP
jgi:hypothetical protein